MNYHLGIHDIVWEKDGKILVCGNKLLKKIIQNLLDLVKMKK